MNATRRRIARDIAIDLVASMAAEWPILGHVLMLDAIFAALDPGSCRRHTAPPPPRRPGHCSRVLVPRRVARCPWRPGRQDAATVVSSPPPTPSELWN